jgi:hypothetical protein
VRRRLEDETPHDAADLFAISNRPRSANLTGVAAAGDIAAYGQHFGAVVSGQITIRPLQPLSGQYLSATVSTSTGLSPEQREREWL